MHAQGSWRRNKTVSTSLLAGLIMSAKRDDQTAISKSLKSGTLPTFTMLRSLLSVEKVPRELVYRNFQELSSSGKFSHAFHFVVSYPRNVINPHPAELSGGDLGPRTVLFLCNKLCCIAVALSVGAVALSVGHKFVLP